MQQLLAHLRTVGKLTLYRKDSSIFFQGEVPRHAIIILDGAVKGYTISPDGDETIVNLFGKGAILPIEWLNSQSSTSLFNYDAHSDVRALSITKNNLLDAIDTNSEYMREYLDLVSQSQAALMLRVTGLCKSRATEKICYTLYYLAFRYGIERPNGIVEINLKITQGLLAKLIGQTRESTAKNLRSLKDAGVVNYTSSTYLINKQKLENYLGEDSFRNLDFSN
ncbi:MAG: Crp/Fnr family transcriptional regulator [Candidatus Saccharimonas sp.]|nr:Crp/Fnr family transcriptional regulator [Candidatus Saccharimonas sp.]